MKPQRSSLFNIPLYLARCRDYLGTLLCVLFCCLCWVSPAQAAEQQPEAPACRFQEIYYKLYIETEAVVGRKVCPEIGPCTVAGSNGPDRHERIGENTLPYPAPGEELAGMSVGTQATSFSRAHYFDTDASSDVTAWLPVTGNMDENTGIFTISAFFWSNISLDPLQDVQINTAIFPAENTTIRQTRAASIGQVFIRYDGLIGEPEQCLMGKPEMGLVTGNGLQAVFHREKVDTAEGQIIFGREKQHVWGWLPCKPPALQVMWQLRCQIPQVGPGIVQAAAESYPLEITWVTPSDSTATAFNIYRAPHLDGEYVQINTAPLPPDGELNSFGYKNYIYTDMVAAGIYYYKLEIVEQDGSRITYGPAAPQYAMGEQPVDVQVTSFTVAREGGDTLRLAWATKSELGGAGFVIHQATDAAGPYTRIDASVTPGQLLPTIAGSYSYTTPLAGAPTYYKLEALDIQGGSVFYGPIQLQEEGAQPLVFAPEPLLFTGTAGKASPPAQQLTINRAAGSAVNWTASESIDWLTLSALSGTTPATINVTVDSSGLSGGRYPEMIHFTSGAQVKSVPVVLLLASETSITTLTVAAPSSLEVGQPIEFKATSDGTNVTYTWNFGDGKTGSGAVVTHTYAAAGNYTATVTATNSLGQRTASTSVVVTAEQNESYKLFLPFTQSF